MAERLTEAQFSTQCAFIAKNAAAWAGDILTLPERYNEIASPANVGRFTDEMRWRLNRLDAWAGRSAPAKITDHMIEAAKKELFGKGLVDTFTIRAALEAALTAAPASAAEPVAWKKVPAEATKELLSDASSKQAGDKQVLCYENGAYYNAWLVFEEYEGGWIWMNEADSEPNPSHYTVLPSPPLTTDT